MSTPGKNLRLAYATISEIMRDPGITRLGISIMTEASPDTVHEHLKAAMDAGIIRRVNHQGKYLYFMQTKPHGEKSE